jgi:hypothetical protein
LFVTEQGTCDASGNGNFDPVNSNIWWDWCDKYNISWCNWSVSDKVETASALNPNASINGNWTTADLTQSGVFTRNELVGSYVPPVVTNQAPYITSQPQNVFLPIGSSASFTVAATSVSACTYQWKKNGENIPGATTVALTFPSISYTDTASYTVSITNSIGTTISNKVTLTIGSSQAYTGVPIAIPGRLEVENFDKGGEMVSYHETEPANQGAAYRLTEGVDIEACTDIGTGYNIGYIVTGEWLDYTVKVANNGTYDITFRVAALAAGGRLSLSVDGVTKIASVTIPSTTGWQIWQNVAVPNIALTSGIHTVRLTAVVGNFNLNYVDFVSKTIVDCNGDANGTAYYDNCKICVGGKTGLTACVSQTISLVKGWNLISTNVLPTDKSIATVFAGLDVQEIKSADAFWIKGQNAALNQLQTIEAGKGYLVKMNVAGNLVVAGTPCPAVLPYAPTTGWNLIGCPYQTATPISTYYTATNSQTIKNFEGFWEPNGGALNSILNLEPGKAYYLKK